MDKTVTNLAVRTPDETPVAVTPEEAANDATSDPVDDDRGADDADSVNDGADEDKFTLRCAPTLSSPSPPPPSLYSMYGAFIALPHRSDGPRADAVVVIVSYMFFGVTLAVRR
jgi:hypothetical protein